MTMNAHIPKDIVREIAENTCKQQKTHKKTEKATAFFCVFVLLKKKLKWISAMTGKQTNKNNLPHTFSKWLSPEASLVKHECSYLCEEAGIPKRAECED